MTGVELYKRASQILEGVGQPVSSLDPVRYVTALGRALDRINSRACIYWRRLRFPTGRMSSGNLIAVSSRFWRPYYINTSSNPLVGNDLLGILRASCAGSPLRVIGAMQFAGLGHTAVEDGATDTPKLIWLDRDPSLGVVIGLDPKPDKVYWIHFAVWCRVPKYTNPIVDLPVIPQAHDAVLEALLVELTESESDFHRKTFHQEHLAALEMAIKNLPGITERVEIVQNNVPQQFQTGNRAMSRSRQDF